MDGLQAVQGRIAELQAYARSALFNAGSRVGNATFPAVLDRAITLTTGDGVDALERAQRLAPGEYGRLEPPVELTRFGNGRIPAEVLTPIGVGDHRLYDPAARAFRRLVDDATRSGVSIGITDSYRSYEQQVRLAEEKGLYRNGGLAATPGTSNHGWGMAVDLDLDDAALAWMRENAWRYGFAEDTPREPWHWAYRPTSGT